MKKTRQSKRQSDINIINNKFKSLFTKDNSNIMFHILPYLTYKEVISLSNTNKSFFIIIRSHKSIKSYIINSKLQPEHRLLFYITNLNISETKSTIEKELSEYNIKSDYYKKILNLSKEAYINDKRFKKICDEIGRDLHRTFYNEKFKKGNGSLMLKNILTALGFVRPEIGYCQGMNFIVGALINFINDEETCFWIFLHFIDNIKLKDLYLQNMPDYLIKLYQINFFIKEYYPKMHHHLKTTRINLDIFFSKWILTVFSNFLDFDTLYNVWDLFILDKWKAIFKFSIIIASYMKDDLINIDLHTYSSYVRNNSLNSLKFKELSRYYNKYKITNSKLNELKEDFYVEQLKTKLEINNSEFDNNENYYISNYQSQLNNFINNLKRPVELLQIQITKLNLECEKAKKKYEKKLLIVKELKSKIENEIESKVAYESTLNLLKSEIYQKEDKNIFYSNKNNIQINDINRYSDI